jgi:hypothetical protein
VALEQRHQVVLARDPGVGRDQRRPDRDPDRLAVEGIAAVLEQHRVHPEGRGVAEEPAEVVVVADAHEGQDQRALGQGGQHGLRLRLGGAHPEPQDAPMDREAGDRVHDLLRRDIGRRRPRQGGDHVGQSRDALLGQEQGLEAVASGPDRRPQHHLALGHEAAGPPRQVGVAHVAVAGEPGIARILDGDKVGHGLSRRPARRRGRWPGR